MGWVLLAELQVLFQRNWRNLPFWQAEAVAVEFVAEFVLESIGELFISLAD